MVKIKEIVKDAEEVSGLEDYEDLSVEGGIFDEDLSYIDDDIEGFENIDEEEPSSDFDIGTTILAVSSPVESWSGQNLEETISRERVERDWKDEDEFVSGDFYKNSEGKNDVYGVGGDVYSSVNANRGGGIYEEASAAYESSNGGYNIQSGNSGGLKGYDQNRDEHRGEYSMLETLGFEDKGKKAHREFTSEFVSGDLKDAA